MLDALNRRCDWHEKNTEVEECGTGWMRVYLHGNLICRQKPDGKRLFSIAGWNTPTTRSRLNALGCGVRTRREHLYRDGVEWDGYDWR